MTPALSRVFPVPLYFFSSPTYRSDADIRSEFAANVLEQLSGMLPENAELEVHLIDSDTTADIHSTTAIDRTSEIAFFVPLSGSTQPWMLSVSRHHRHIVLINAYLPGFFSAELQAQIMHDNAHPACADYYARMRRDTKSIVWISNSKSLSSVWFAWQASQRVKNARILRIGETEPWLLNSCRDPETFREKLGTEIIPVELDALYASIHELEQDTVESDAESWVSGATSLVGVDASDILKATNVTRALEQMVSSHRADGLSIACFAMIGALDTTSCLAMSKFNDSSDRIGACEGDLDAAITMLLLKGLGAEFVWIGNPIIQDT